MTKEELIQKLSEIEWDDFECKSTYWFGGQAKEQAKEQAWEQAWEQPSDQAGEQVLRLVNVIRENAYSLSDLLKKLNLKGRRNFLVNYLTPAIEGGYVLRAYPDDKPNHPQQKYYLSEKGLKLVKWVKENLVQATAEVR